VLLHLAHALTGDETAGAQACGQALHRIATSWPQVVRGDPDLEVRRLLVRSCPSRHRAAAVLHRTDGRSDAEIADVLGCPVGTVRSAISRALTALRAEVLEVKL
jgi:DNA-directed RNA polymerase specialized sigma24 family protein